MIPAKVTTKAEVSLLGKRGEDISCCGDNSGIVLFAPGGRINMDRRSLGCDE